jgi:uncharacterized membrane protein
MNKSDKLVALAVIIFIASLLFIARGYNQRKVRERKELINQVENLRSNAEVLNRMLKPPSVVIIVTNGVGNAIAVELPMSAWLSTNQIVVSNRMKLWK